MPNPVEAPSTNPIVAAWNIVLGWFRPKKSLPIILVMFAVMASAEDKPNVTVAKMTDAEYAKLDSASLEMQKAAEAYRKAADAYAKTKDDLLGKYNALESKDCHIQKIVDLRGQYIIVETRPQQYFLTFGGGSSYDCNAGWVTSGNIISNAGTDLVYRPNQ